ncbi:MAG: replicative DNA helicase [Lachnospiraceae bacterium]|nr:replicative DNA helicase [Lachnospiraceae bacterium]MBR5766073.1 replicative DNA helicase [Lachnospiraceae bacterium]
MSDAVIKRIMPHDREAEQSVIGSMLMDKEAIVVASEVLMKEDFYEDQYGLLFKAMVELYNDAKPVDLVTLKAKLIEMGVPEEISNMEYMVDIVNNTYTSANIREYASIVADKAVLRRLIKFNDETNNQCYSPRESTDDILAEAEKNIFNIVSRRGSGDYVPIRKIVVDALQHLSLVSKSKGNVTGIATGFTDLDYKTAGLQPSDLVLIAARPSMGKTAFVLNMAQHICFKDKRNAVIFSLEMSKEQLINRLLSLESRVDSQAIRTGTLSDTDWENVIEGAETIAKSGLIIDDTPGISISELRSRCRRYHQEFGLSVVIIDYLQLMSGKGRTDSRQQEISEISRSLKALARELHVPVVALSQLSRAVEKRDDHRPMLSDLRESGAIEQDADVVMFLYRDDYYNKESEKQGIAEVIIAKQRNGPIGTVELVWLPNYTKFANKAK